MIPIQKFNTSRQYLKDKIFVPQPPKQGSIWTNLNVTVLPDFLAYIKLKLTKQQQILLSQYHLQTYMLETALKAHPNNDFDTCTNQIIAHIRTHPEFWVKKQGSQQQSLKHHQAISQFLKDAQLLANQYKPSQIYPQKPYKLSTSKKIQNDYVYVKNQYLKNQYRFNSTLFCWVAQYACKQHLLQSNQYVKMFLLDLLVSLAIKSKPRQKKYQGFRKEEEKEANDRIQKQIQLFKEYLQEKEVDDKCLSSIKDYYIISNGLLLSKSFIKAYKHKSQSTSSRNQIPPSFDIQLIQQVLIDLGNRFILDSELSLITSYLLQSQYDKSCDLLKIRDQLQSISRNQYKAYYNTPQQITLAYQQFNQIVNHPQNTNRMKYKLEGSQVSWTEDLYPKFLQAFLQYFNVPTNNKKIATMMGKNIQPNHVKHVKGLYMRNMATRIDNGEIGGGKKGIFQSKKEFLKKDIQNFSMKWFKKQHRNKTKRIKRRKKRQTYDGEQHDSDY